jgi:hypothetical protein
MALMEDHKDQMIKNLINQSEWSITQGNDLMAVILGESQGILATQGIEDLDIPEVKVPDRSQP